MSALRFVPTAPPSQPRAKALRVEDVPHTLPPLRYTARTRGAAILDEKCVAHGVGNGTLSACFGDDSDRAGGRARSGKLVVTFNEAIALLPLPLMIDVIGEALLERFTRERVSTLDTPELRLAAVHVDALRTLLAHR